jgi:hypothetical protein
METIEIKYNKKYTLENALNYLFNNYYSDILHVTEM